MLGNRRKRRKKALLRLGGRVYLAQLKCRKTLDCDILCYSLAPVSVKEM